MKKSLGILMMGTAALCGQLEATPLEQAYVDEEAQWLAHLDMDALKASSLGQFAIAQLKLEIARNTDTGFSIDVDRVVAELNSITAYGGEIQNGAPFEPVLILQSGPKLIAILDGFLAHDALMNEGESIFKDIENAPHRTVLVGKDLYVANPEEGLLLASKRLEQIDAAYAVMQGREASLQDGQSDLLLNNAAGFFLIATATGLDRLQDMPPQARILQKTRGGQISLGEQNGLARAVVALSTESQEVSQQLARIVQGMLALASFANLEEQGLSGLVESVQVAHSGRNVSLDMSYPVEALLDLIQTAIESNRNDESYSKSGDNLAPTMEAGHGGETGN